MRTTNKKLKKILVTGGAGFIGSAMAKRLMEDEKNYVVIVDNLSTGNIGKIPPLDSRPRMWKFIKCDVNNYHDIAEVMLSYKFDYIFHYAAVVGVSRTQENPVWVLNDIEGIKNILSIAKNTGVKRVFYSSSSEIYGEPVEIPQHVYTTPLNSRLPYAIVKNVGEAFLRSYQQEYGLNYTIFRFFNTYGPKQSKDFVISKFINKALRNEDLTIYGDGHQTRTFCYIDDNVETCYKIFENDLLINDVINIGGSEEVAILDLAKLVIEKTGSKSKIVHVPPLKDGDMKRRKPENTPMIEILARPLLSLEDGIEKILKTGLFETDIQNS
ncbi:MAG: NAD-dependent epimerase/dehydratase family protein [Salinivirgaceae bacterium]|jgi:nucleoside-diphosphate-sugar epimerase|nr:NAD-dependent epimerase/dehydratase family protein [Bacteroidales bacterium]